MRLGTTISKTGLILSLLASQILSTSFADEPGSDFNQVSSSILNSTKTDTIKL